MMPEPSTLAVFVLAAVALLVTPGPAVLYIVTRSVEQGRWAGLVSALGVHVGTLVHVAAAALGLSALLVSSALAFDIVKYLGALYLIYLGIRRLLTDPAVQIGDEDLDVRVAQAERGHKQRDNHGRFSSTSFRETESGGSLPAPPTTEPRNEGKQAADHETGE